MLDELLPYYEHELTFLRQLGKEFAEQYPDIASRLLIEGERCEDPHVERLLQGFAFLSARIHRKLDDEFPEITDALLGILYPHFLRPIPSMSIAQFQIDPANPQITTRYTIERHTQLFSRGVAGIHNMQCRFRTSYPVELWPIRVADAKVETIERSPFARGEVDAAGVIRIKLATIGELTFSELGIDRLRFFIDGEPAMVHALYELLFNNTSQIVLATAANAVNKTVLPRSAIRSVGFGPEEGTLEYDPRSFLGYRLLHEYFTFPDKFLFFDITDLNKVSGQKIGKELEIAFLIGQSEREDRLARLGQVVSSNTFRLGCTPVVNLFKQRGEPIRLTHQKAEYPIIPDVRQQRGMEVYSIDGVHKLVKSRGREERVEYQPFYSYKHGAKSQAQNTYWYATRRRSPAKDDMGTDLFLSLVDLDFNPSMPDTETLSLELTCTNRDVPAQLPFGGDQGELQMEGAAAVSRIRFIRKPTPAVRPPLGKAGVWRLISHLSLNHLSIVEEGREALLEILDLYNFSRSPGIRSQIAGITKVESHKSVARIRQINLPVVGETRTESLVRSAFVRGTSVQLEFDEDAYVGTGVYLFARVLEHFLGLYCAVNSYVQLTVRTKQREKEMAKWPPRTGEAILL
jgi:type VI secretion system protein ImpG